MAYSRPSSYPYPRNLVDHKGELSPIGVKEHLEQLYKSMLENDSRGEYAKDKDTDIDLKELIVRPEWYGAKGDGVHDDTAAINAAGSSIRPEGAITDQSGGVVQFAAKRYVVKGTIVGKPGVVFKGCGGMQYNSQSSNRARKATWIDHQPTSANTDCFVFDTSTWDNYGRASGCGVRDLYVSGTTNSRRMISYPDGVIKPVIENVQTEGGSIGLYFVYAIESSFRYSTFVAARDYGVYIGYTADPTHSTSTDVSFFGCNIWGQDITGTGLYADWSITTNYFGGAIYECTDHLVHVGVDKSVEINFYGTHFETGAAQAGYIIKTGDVAAAKSVVRLFGARVQYTYATLTNPYAVVSNYASALVFSGAILGAGYAFDCTTNTDNIFIGDGCQWGGAFGSVVPATDDVSMMPRVIGFSYTGTATSNANSLYRANSYATTVQAAAYAASFIPRPQLGGIIKVSLTGNMTVNGPNSDYGGSPDMAVTGHTMLFDLTADATPRVVTWWTPYTTQWAGGAQTIPANTRQLVRFYYDGLTWIQDGVVLDQPIASSDGPTFDHLHITNHIDANSISTTGTGGSYNTGVEVRAGANLLIRPAANDFDWKIRSIIYALHFFQGLDDTNPVMSMLHTGEVGVNDPAPAEKLDINGNINTTGVIKVADIQVVGAQAVTQAALKADYTTGDLDTEAEVIAAINATNAGFNTLLAKLKTHGLIAT